MVKRIFLFLIISLLALYQSSGTVSKPDPIKLIAEALIATSQFYVNAIVDERVVKAPVFNLLAADASGTIIKQKSDLHGGYQTAIENFFAASMKKDHSLRPLNIRIKECNVTETLSGENRVIGKVNIVLEFDLVKESGDIYLTKYQGGAKYTRSIKNSGIIEPVFRQALSNGLKFIDTWMNREADRNIHLAKGVKISFDDYLDQHPDTVYYDSARPLVWTDFKDKPRDNKFTAAIFSSFGYDQSREIVNGIINVDLALKVYMVKSDSWVFAGREDRYNLNHEQRHFDLTKVVATKFRKKLLQENLTPDNYEGIINYEYLEFYREMNRVQKQYDEETGHGTNRAAQAEWNRNIDLDLTLQNASIF